MKAATITATPSARRASCFIFVLALTLAFACTKADERPAPRPTPVTPLERGIRQARQQRAKNIFVISRADGGEITAEDRAYIKQNLPRDYVYSGITDDNRNVIVSMHVEFPAANIDALRRRFNVGQVQT